MEVPELNARSVSLHLFSFCGHTKGPQSLLCWVQSPDPKNSPQKNKNRGQTSKIKKNKLSSPDVQQKQHEDRFENNVGLKSRMEIVWSNKAMKNNFDQTAQYLQEADPVFLRSIKQGGSGGSNTSKSKNATASQLNLKQGVGKTGVEF